MNPSYGPARIEIVGGLLDDVDLGQVDLLGESPNASASLFIWEPATEGKNGEESTPGRFRHLDRLTQAKITGSEKSFTIEGVSEQLTNEVELAGEDAIVKWIVTPKACVGCR